MGIGVLSVSTKSRSNGALCKPCDVILPGSTAWSRDLLRREYLYVQSSDREYREKTVYYEVAVHPCVCVNDNKQTQLICHSHRIPPLGISATVFSGSTNARALNQVPSSIGQFFPSLLPPSLWVHSHTCLFSGNYFPVTVVIEGAINPWYLFIYFFSFFSLFAVSQCARFADVQFRGIARPAALSPIVSLPSMNPTDLLRFLSKPAK